MIALERSTMGKQPRLRRPAIKETDRLRLQLERILKVVAFIGRHPGGVTYWELRRFIVDRLEVCDRTAHRDVGFMLGCGILQETTRGEAEAVTLSDQWGKLEQRFCSGKASEVA